MDTQHTYLLALEVEPMTVGRSYVDLPLHCTLVHRFHSSLAAANLAARLEPIIEVQPAVWLQAEDSRSLGPNHKIVSLLDKSEPLMALHRATFNELNRWPVQYTEEDWVGDGYTPHVTNQGDQQFSTGSRLLSSHVYVIEIEHPLHGPHKYIAAVLPLVR